MEWDGYAQEKTEPVADTTGRLASAAGHCALRPDIFAPEADLLAGSAGNGPSLLSDGGALDEIERLRLPTRTGRPVGGVMFLNLLETVLKRAVRPHRRGRARKERPET